MMARSMTPFATKTLSRYHTSATGNRSRGRQPGMALATTPPQSSSQSAHPEDGPRGPRRAFPVALLAFLVALFFLNIVSRLSVGPLLPVIEREFGLRHGGVGSWIVCPPT